MDQYKYSTFCLHILKLWNNKEVHLLEENNQGTFVIYAELSVLTVAVFINYT